MGFLFMIELSVCVCVDNLYTYMLYKPKLYAEHIYICTLKASIKIFISPHFEIIVSQKLFYVIH